MPEELPRDRIFVALEYLVVVVRLKAGIQELSSISAIFVGKTKTLGRRNATHLINQRVLLSERNMPDDPRSVARVLGGLEGAYHERDDAIWVRSKAQFFIDMYTKH
jgi:hypothetical protein